MLTLYLLLQATLSYAQTTADVAFIKSSPLGCFARGDQRIIISTACCTRRIPYIV